MLLTFGGVVFLQKKSTLNYFSVVCFCFSIICICISLIMQNSSFYYYDDISNNYVFRISMLFFVFLVSSSYLNNMYSNRKDAFFDFSKLLFILIVASIVFEYSIRAIDFKPILYLYKARQDLGGIDSVHYNRFSGFTSFPGDMAALIALSFVCVQVFLRSKIMLLILFGAIILTQSKAGLILLLIFYIARSATKFSVKNIILVLLSTVLSLYIIQALELEYYIRFLENLEHYAFESKRAQEMLLFLKASSIESLFGNFSLNGMYFESEIFSTLNRNGIIGSLWLFILFVSCVFIYFTRKVSCEKDVVLFLLVFIGFYCFMSAGFSRSKIGIFYVFFIAIFTIPNFDNKNKRQV